MSSDESTATHISTISNGIVTKKKKLQKPEQWEIDLTGTFLLSLYHRTLITPGKNWLIKKAELRKEYSNFISNDLNRKWKELNSTSDIGTLLSRCGYLINTQRGSDEYKIKNSELFKFRNNNMEKMDNLKINSDIIAETKSGNTLENMLFNLVGNVTSISIEDNLEVDEEEQKSLLEYQGKIMNQRTVNFCPTNTSCCICEEEFSTMENFEEHIQKHGEESNFEFSSIMTKESPLFILYYRLCKNSHYFCFELETSAKDLIIEKIIIVQSRSFYYVHNMRVPYKIPQNGKDRFFVDSHLFTIHVEQPIVLIYHLESNKEIRIVEQHHFMRCEEFPKVNFAINPYRLPDNKVFKAKCKLADYFPSKEIRDSLKDEFYHEKLMKTSNEFRDYIQNGKNLQPQTIGASLNILLQIEDIDMMQQYLNLTQKNIKLRKYGCEYSFCLKPKHRVFIESILSLNDEIVLTTHKDICNNSETIMQLMIQNTSDIENRKNIFVGIVEAVNTGRISFKCSRKININVKYTVICRPSRLNLRYQYRSLELLFNNMKYLRKFLFPTKIMPMPLSTISLNLYNDKIASIPEQLQAVRNIAEGPRNDATYIIFGPPGTGKTTTLVEAILQLLKNPNTKILVTASSNSACDEIALHLCKYLQILDIKRCLVRIFSRSCEGRSDYIDDELLENSNMYNVQFYPDIEILHEYRIVICTLSVVGKLATGNFGSYTDGKAVYTHLFIDEIAASMEADALMAIAPILSANSCLIISGDHKQLGPILHSKRAKELGLDVSLMERLLDRDCYRVDVDTGDYDRTIQTRLRRNYRSHPAIVNLFSGLYYNHNVEPYAKIEDVSLGDIWYKTKDKNYPIIFHAIYGPCTSDNQSNSLYNMMELRVVLDYVKDFMYYGINGEPVKESDIGIISPYKKQCKRIQEELSLRKWFGIETGSVEIFQGKEKEIIIVSFVRSRTRTLGFLENPRRLNVTLSRPKSILILIGNPETLSLNSEFEYIIKECKRHNTFTGSSHQDRTESVLNQTVEGLCMSNDNLNTKLSKLDSRGFSKDKNIDTTSNNNADNEKEDDTLNKMLMGLDIDKDHDIQCSRRHNEHSKSEKNGKNKIDRFEDIDESKGNYNNSEKDEVVKRVEKEEEVGKEEEGEGEGEGEDEDVDEGEEDDDGDKSSGNDKASISAFATSTIKSGTNNKGKLKRNPKRRGGTKGNTDKIFKQHQKDKRKKVAENYSNSANKEIEMLVDELPQVPKTTIEDNFKILTAHQHFNFPIVQQHQQAYCEIQKQHQQPLPPTPLQYFSSPMGTNINSYQMQYPPPPQPSMHQTLYQPLRHVSPYNQPMHQSNVNLLLNYHARTQINTNNNNNNININKTVGNNSKSPDKNVSNTSIKTKKIGSDSNYGESSSIKKGGNGNMSNNGAIKKTTNDTTIKNSFKPKSINKSNNKNVEKLRGNVSNNGKLSSKVKGARQDITEISKNQATNSISYTKINNRNCTESKVCVPKPVSTTGASAADKVKINYQSNSNMFKKSEVVNTSNNSSSNVKVFPSNYIRTNSENSTRSETCALKSTTTTISANITDSSISTIAKLKDSHNSSLDNVNSLRNLVDGKSNFNLSSDSYKTESPKTTINVTTSESREISPYISSTATTSKNNQYYSVNSNIVPQTYNISNTTTIGNSYPNNSVASSPSNIGGVYNHRRPIHNNAFQAKHPVDNNKNSKCLIS